MINQKWKGPIKIVLGVIMISLFVFIYGCLKYQNNPERTYEEFNNICNLITSQLNLDYDVIKAKPKATVYDGNLNQKWTKEEFTIMNGQMSQPRQKEYFINNDNYISKIIFSYIPNIQENLYLQVDRFGEKERKEAKEIEDSLYPTWAINSFTIKGIYIQVETIGIMQDSQIEDELVTFNSQLTSDIQRIILDFEND